jgi:hypothetical protein
MIDKRVPRKLNSSKDNRIRQKDEFNDALNISITDDYGDIGGTNAAATTDSGDAGVIRPALGNSAINLQGLFDDASTTRRCIGSVSDTRTGLVFFFVASDSIEEMGVYAIDTQGYFVGQNTEVAIFRSPQFNFQPTSLVVAQVVHLYDDNSDDEQGQFRPYLYFTDNVNEPRRLDVVRAQQAEQEYNGELHNIVDFITACPKTPLEPVSFQWGTDLSRSVSEFRGVNGFTFAYQCIYRSGEETALSTFSELAVPPIFVSQGSSTSQNLNADNYISLTIPKVVVSTADGDTSYNYTDEIERIRLLVREGDVGTWFVIDEIEAPAGDDDITYDFYNDRVLTGIRVEEANKQFDNLPQMAEAIAVVENRLFYGNYIEGYDNDTVEANIAVSYINRPQDFVDVNIDIKPVILPRTASVDENLAGNVGESYTVGVDPANRIAGYMVDTSSINSDIPEGSIINFSLRISPARDWHMYDSRDSYHSFKRMGVDGTADNQSTFVTNMNGSGAFPTMPVMGAGNGIGNDGFGDQISWETTESREGASSTNVKVGSSAASPLVIQGKPIEFSVTAVVTSAIEAASSAVTLRNIVCQLITGQSHPDVDVIGNAQTQAGYIISQPLDFVHVTDPDTDEDIQAKHAKLNPSNQADLNIIQTITPVFDAGIDLNVDTTELKETLPSACGYFMLRNANVQFSLDRKTVLESNYGDQTKGFLAIKLDFLNIQGAYDDPEPGIVTCIPYSGALDYSRPISESAFVKEWRVYKYYDLIENESKLLEVNWDEHLELDQNGDPVVTQANPYYNLFQEVEIDFTSDANFPLNWESYSVNQRKKWIGGLKYEQGDATLNFRNNLLRTDDDQFAGSGGPIVDFSLVDGDQGLTNTRRLGEQLVLDSYFNHEATEVNEGDINGIQYDQSTGVQEGPFSLPQILFGHVSSRAGGEDLSPVNGFANTLYPIVTNTYQSNANQTPNRRVILNSPVFSRFGDATLEISFNFFNDINPPSAAVNVLNANAFFTEGEDGDVVRSFKSSANHSLGVVYYDERGRSGPVAPLPSRDNPSVYVAGYSNEERDGLQGRVEMIVSMNTPPPPWAWNYQFVYAGNSTYDDFIQYSVGGAFVPTDNVSEGKSIYLSLNYLQVNNDVSYAEAWGAVDYTGDKRFYQFVPGDYVRIISYNTDEDTRVFPVDLIFEITNAVTLPDNIEENPISGGVFVDDGAGVHPARRGSFIIVRDNPAAAGFTASDVAVGSTQIDTNAHFWNNRTVVEIVRPKKLSDSEDRVYYEIGKQYRVVRNPTGNLTHQFEQHLIRQGDVWWRRVPVNIPEYDESNNIFVNLIQEENEEELISNAPRFRDVYLESMTFNDTYSGNNVLGYGKPKFVGPQRQRVRRFSSITFSDVNDYATKVNRFTSFNSYNAPFKDLPNEYGNINYILDFNGGLFVIQKDKASQVPVSRDIITTATGQDSIVVSNKILGSQILYAGSYGADNNPESVIKVDNNIYFAHKSRGEVYKFNPSNGIQVISDKGMATALRAAFEEVNYVEGGATQAWIVSGYDPLNDEYLLTINQIGNFGIPNLGLYDRPVDEITEVDDPRTVIIGGGGGGTGGGGGGPDEPVGDVFNYDEESVVPSNEVTDPIDELSANWGQLPTKKGDIIKFDADFELVKPSAQVETAFILVDGAPQFYPEPLEGIASYGEKLLFAVIQGAGAIYNPSDYDAATFPEYVRRPENLGSNPFLNGQFIDLLFKDIDLRWMFTPSQAMIATGGQPIDVLNPIKSSVIGTFYPATRHLALNANFHVRYSVGDQLSSPNPSLSEFALDFVLRDVSNAIFGNYANYVTTNAATELGNYILAGDYNSILENNVSIPLIYSHILGAALTASDFNQKRADTHDNAVDVHGNTGVLYDEANALANEIVDFLGSENLTNPTLLNYASDVTNAANNLAAAEAEYPWSDTVKTFPSPSQNSVPESAVGYNVNYQQEARGGVFDAFLTSVSLAATNLNAVVTTLNPNTLLDAQDVYNNFSARVAELETTIDILTDQLENASSSTVDILTVPVIENVTEGQSNALTLGVLANQNQEQLNERTLTVEDLITSTELGELLSFSASQVGLATINSDLIKEVIHSYIANNQSFTNRGVYSPSRSLLNTTNLLSEIMDNRSDQDVNGVTGAPDILELLLYYGQFNNVENVLTQEEFDAQMNTISNDIVDYLQNNA